MGKIHLQLSSSLQKAPSGYKQYYTVKKGNPAKWKIRGQPLVLTAAGTDLDSIDRADVQGELKNS